MIMTPVDYCLIVITVLVATIVRDRLTQCADRERRTAHGFVRDAHPSVSHAIDGDGCRVEVVAPGIYDYEEREQWQR